MSQEIRCYCWFFLVFLFLFLFKPALLITSPVKQLVQHMWCLVSMCFLSSVPWGFEGGASWGSSLFHLQLPKLLTFTFCFFVFWTTVLVLSWFTSLISLRICFSVLRCDQRWWGSSFWLVAAFWSSHWLGLVSWDDFFFIFILFICSLNSSCK